MQIFVLCNKQGRGISKRKKKNLPRKQVGEKRIHCGLRQRLTSPAAGWRLKPVEKRFAIRYQNLKKNKNNKSAHICFDQTLSFLCLPFQNRIN
jgi:hypothetical protein